MTVAMKNNIRTYLPYTGLLGIIYLIFSMGSWKVEAENKMFDNPSQKEQIILHAKSTGKHMILKDKEDHFVTRREYEITLKNIEKSLDNLNKQITQQKQN